MRLTFFDYYTSDLNKVFEGRIRYIKFLSYIFHQDVPPLNNMSFRYKDTCFGEILINPDSYAHFFYELRISCLLPYEPNPLLNIIERMDWIEHYATVNNINKESFYNLNETNFRSLTRGLFSKLSVLR